MTPGANNAVLLVLLVFALAGLWLLRRADRSRRRRQKAWTYPDYVQGLHLLLRGRKDEAARAFRAAIETEPYAMEARLRLGDLLRAKGAIDQATRLHHSVIAVPTLSSSLRRDATLALAEDLKAAGRAEAATEAIQRGLATLGHDDALAFRLLQALEESGRWERALEVARTLEKTSARSMKPREALYRVERAKESLAAGNYRRARADLRKALADDPKCGPARLVSGDAYLQQGEMDKAVAEWLRLSSDVPEMAPQALSRIERALYDAGDYGRILDIYQALLEARPGDVETLCRLALHDERIGSLDKALERAQQAAEAAPASVYPRALAASFLCELGRPDEAAALCREIAQLVATAERYLCPYCGVSSQEFAWRCPSCARVGLFVRSVVP